MLWVIYMSLLVLPPSWCGALGRWDLARSSVLSTCGRVTARLVLSSSTVIKTGRLSAHSDTLDSSSWLDYETLSQTLSSALVVRPIGPLR